MSWPCQTPAAQPQQRQGHYEDRKRSLNDREDTAAQLETMVDCGPNRKKFAEAVHLVSRSTYSGAPSQHHSNARLECKSNVSRREP